MAYLVERGVNLFFHHPYVARCEEPPGGSIHILIRLSEGECVRARYLGPTAELTDHMCRHPEHF